MPAGDRELRVPKALRGNVGEILAITDRLCWEHLEVDGMIVDARWLPAELQAEAYRRGLMPDLSLTEAA